MGRHGQRVHAAADAGGARRARLDGVDGDVADARRARRREPGRRPARVGQARLSRVGRCACTPPPRRSATSTAAQVPSDVDALEALPGVGAYTARAVAAFGYGRRCPVVDTNVRRVVARAVHGAGDAGPARVTADLADVDALLPADDGRAAVISAGLMELGAVVCTARAPRCGACPVRDLCAWRAAGPPRVRRPAQGRPDVRGHRPAGPRPPPRRPARRRDPRRAGGPRRRVGRRRPARPLPVLAAGGRPHRAARPTAGSPSPPERARRCSRVTPLPLNGSSVTLLRSRGGCRPSVRLCRPSGSPSTTAPGTR